MHRLKLTTIKGKVFLSPFVYTEEQAKRRMRSLKWLVKKVRNQEGKILKSGKLEMIPVEKWPFRAEYNYDRAINLEFLTILERRWEDVYNKENFDEMEEGSA